MMEHTRWEIWVGAYAEPEQTGITRLEMDGDTGELVKTAEYGGIENPSFLALNRAGTVLYAVSETSETDNQPGGRMIAYPIDADTRKLQPGWERLTHGADPCHVSLDPAERWLAVANYSGESVTLYPLETNGKPGDAMVRLRHAGAGAHPRQASPHPHSSVFDPQDGRYLYIPDLGLDRVMIYEPGDDGVDWRAAGTASLASADGPRHMAFHPDGRSFYVVNELSNSVSRFVRADNERWERQETVSTLPDSYQGESNCAEIAASPDGRYVYVSNRGHDSMAAFRLDDASGALIPAGHVSTRGKHPRHFAILPDGKWMIVVNRDSNNLVVYQIDAHSGLPIYHGIEISVHRPVCIRARAL